MPLKNCVVNKKLPIDVIAKNTRFFRRKIGKKINGGIRFISWRDLMALSLKKEKQIADSFTNASGNSISSNGVNGYNFVSPIITPEGNCKLLALPSEEERFNINKIRNSWKALDQMILMVNFISLLGKL